MTAEQIEKFLGNTANNSEPAGQPAKISFKTRNTVEGVFIKTPDYFELKGKNFWRIVTLKNIDSYRTSNDVNLSRIFNGSEFIKLSQVGK